MKPARPADITRALSEGCYIYLRQGNATGDGIRIWRARTRSHGPLEVQSLATGDWITTDAADRIEIITGARVTETLRGDKL